MSQPSRKRPAGEQASSAASKRLRTPVSKIPEVRKNESAFRISVRMAEKFQVYPEGLRNSIQRHHKSLVNQIMTKIEDGLTFEPQFNFTITRRRHSVPKDITSDYVDPRGKTFMARSLANQEVLTEFLARVPLKKPKFFELKMPEGVPPMANPAFTDLHSARAGEMSWGMDKNGCISLHLTSIIDGRRIEESIYVERKSAERLKIEDDNCRVVEDPGTARE